MKKGWFVVNCARTQSRMRAVSATYRADLSYCEYRSCRQVMEELGTQKPAWHCILTGLGIPTEETLAYPIARGGDIDPGTTISSQEREFCRTADSKLVRGHLDKTAIAFTHSSVRLPPEFWRGGSRSPGGRLTTSC